MKYIEIKVQVACDDKLKKKHIKAFVAELEDQIVDVFYDACNFGCVETKVTKQYETKVDYPDMVRGTDSEADEWLMAAREVIDDHPVTEYEDR